MKKVASKPVTIPSSFPPDLANSLHVRQSEIHQLFQSDQREVFQLEYLYRSPLYSRSSPYRQLVQVLEHFNQQTSQRSQGRSFAASNAQSRVRQAVSKLLYRQMMCLATKQEEEIKESNHPSKLRDWYFGLQNVPNFFERLHIKKKYSPENSQDSLIRASYTSNVFDEIDDYLRRKVDFKSETTEVPPPAPPRFQKHQSPPICNLPLIDRVLYQKAHLNMRERREINEEKCFLETMKANKSTNREDFISKINLRSTAINFRSNMREDNPSNNSKLTSLHGEIGLRTMPSHFKFRGSENVSPQKRKNNPTSLANINGLNLIRQHQE